MHPRICALNKLILDQNKHAICFTIDLCQANFFYLWCNSTLDKAPNLWKPLCSTWNGMSICQIRACKIEQYWAKLRKGTREWVVDGYFFTMALDSHLDCDSSWMGGLCIVYCWMPKPNEQDSTMALCFRKQFYQTLCSWNCFVHAAVIVFSFGINFLIVAVFEVVAT